MQKLQRCKKEFRKTGKRNVHSYMRFMRRRGKNSFQTARGSSCILQRLLCKNERQLSIASYGLPRKFVALSIRYGFTAVPDVFLPGLAFFYAMGYNIRTSENQRFLQKIMLEPHQTILKGACFMAFEVTPDTIIGDILDTDFDTAPFFLEMGMHCLGCPASRGETVAQACAVHGVDAEELVEKLNNHFANA